MKSSRLSLRAAVSFPAARSPAHGEPGATYLSNDRPIEGVGVKVGLANAHRGRLGALGSEVPRGSQRFAPSFASVSRVTGGRAQSVNAPVP